MNEATKVIRILEMAGHTAVLAGGCVRDMLLNREPSDFDIATIATPEEVEEIFQGKGYTVVPIGKAFGVMLVVVDGTPIEVATFRKDLPYIDYRHPESVEFCSMEEDAKRRDFTINGMFYNPLRDELYDFVNGRKHLEGGILKFIGNAEDRIREDPLRMLRLARFVSKLDFHIDVLTLDPVAKHADLIRKVSAERVREELTKLLMTDDPEKGFEIMHLTHLLAYLLPEVHLLKGCEQDPMHHPEGDVWTHSFKAVRIIGKLPRLRWAALLHDIGKPLVTKRVNDEKGERIISHEHDKKGGEVAERITKRLKFSNEEANEIVWLIKNHMRLMHFSRMKIAKKAKLVQHPWWNDLLLLGRADDLASCHDATMLDEIESWVATAPERIYTRKACINGHDLMKLGIQPGPVMGKILDKIFEFELSGRVQNRETALAEAEQLGKNWGALPTRSM